MRIESIIQRKKGTTVEMDGETYAFNSTTKEQRHIVDVKNKAHVARFLAIPEGYRVADLEDEDEDEAVDIVADETGDTGQALTPDNNAPVADTSDAPPPDAKSTKAPTVKKAASSQSTKRSGGSRRKAKT